MPATPMFFRYSMWIGDTERSIDSDRSSGSPFSSRCGTIGTGTAFTSRDHPQQVAPVQLARLGRDVARRIAQAHELADAGAHGLGHDLARPVGGEAVDHDAVETRSARGPGARPP